MKAVTPADVAPILACFLALVRFLMPIREVLAVRRGGNLGVGIALNILSTWAACCSELSGACLHRANSTLLKFTQTHPGLHSPLSGMRNALLDMAAYKTPTRLACCENFD